ncbi:MAG: RHS repeat-associated core domain-containing protein [Candidatus Acidiferrales bacterium]
MWNAEGELKTAGGVTYTYDGDGNRVEKSNGKIYWYGVDGNVLDETDATGSMTNAAFNEYIYFAGRRLARRDSAGDVFYYGEDVLGSSAAIVETPAGQTTATVCSDSDYYPYGGEKVVTNTCPQNYKWTGKERDAETGNDDFDARYYSPMYGRFLSADWSAVPAAVPYANLTNPQTLNLYAIVRDNPESYADLDGHVAVAGTIESGDGGYGIDQHPDTAAANAAQAQRTQQSQPQTQNANSMPLAPTAPLDLSAIGEGAAVLGGIGILVTLPVAGMAVAVLTPPMAQGDPMTPGYVPAPPATGTPPSTSQQGSVDGRPIQTSRGNNVAPDPNAQGPHSVPKRDPATGKVTGYTTYDANGNARLRYRGQGKTHGGVKPPLVLEPHPGKGPGSPPNRARPARPEEIPQ